MIKPILGSMFLLIPINAYLLILFGVVEDLTYIKIITGIGMFFYIVIIISIGLLIREEIVKK